MKLGFCLHKGYKADDRKFGFYKKPKHQGKPDFVGFFVSGVFSVWIQW